MLEGDESLHVWRFIRPGGILAPFVSVTTMGIRGGPALAKTYQHQTVKGESLDTRAKRPLQGRPSITNIEVP